MGISALVSVNKRLSGHNVLVTGASGFTGAWLTEHLLNQGASMTALFNDCHPHSHFLRGGLADRVTTVIGYVEDYGLLERVLSERRIDTVFHLAAVSVQGSVFENPRHSFDTNVRGTYNLLEACRVHMRSVERVIMASSDKVYGDSDVLPYTEDLPVQGRNPYDVSKACADVIARSYHHSYGLPVVVARFGNIYGGGDLNWSRLIPNTIRRLLNDKPPLVRTPPRGVFKRDFMYVSDLVSAYMALFEGLTHSAVRGCSYNFGTDVSWTVPEIVEKIQRLSGTEHLSPITVEQVQHEILHQQVSARRAEEELGWRPVYSLDEGLAPTVEWYQRAWIEGLSTSDPVAG